VSDKETISYETAESTVIRTWKTMLKNTNQYLVPILLPVVEHFKPLFKEFYDLGVDHGKTAEDWISVSDKMPEQGQKVLVFRPDAHNHPHKDPNFKICTYAGADIFINSHFEHTITHWKPITAPVEVKEPANDPKN